MSGAAQEILKKLKMSLLQLYGNQLKGLYLYGSFARGEEKAGSDLDVAMILENFERPWFEIQRTSQLVSDLSLEYGVTVSLIPLRISDWSMNQRPLVRSIQREGVMV
jgi:type I restriction enzyme S subunit